MKTIDFCIPFTSWGLRYTEFLVSNLLSTAAHPERISISLSAHTQNAVEIINNSSLKHLIKNIVMAPRWDGDLEKKFAMESQTAASANHCSAIHSLFSQAKADIVIFSDYDMAFLVAGWDLEIAELLETRDLCGAGYPNFTYPLNCKEFPELQIIARNYQQTPNLSFLAITRQCIESYFTKGMSTFHQFLANGGLHFQIVNTPEMSKILNLPLGTIWAMDSGFDIPYVIHKNKLRHKTFIPVAFDQQPVFSSTVFTDSASSAFLPDVFYMDSADVEPFLAHYRSGTIKSIKKSDNDASFNSFMTAVNDHLAKRT